MLRERTLSRERKEAAPNLDWGQAHQLERLPQGPLSQGEMVVEEVPVRPAHIPDVGLEDQQTATGFQHPANLPQGREEILLEEKMLEEVTGKRDIDGVVSQSAQVCAGALEYLDTRPG